MSSVFGRIGLGGSRVSSTPSRSLEPLNPKVLALGTYEFESFGYS